MIQRSVFEPSASDSWKESTAGPGAAASPERGDMTIPVAQAPVSHEWGARRVHSRQRSRRAALPAGSGWRSRQGN